MLIYSNEFKKANKAPEQNISNSYFSYFLAFFGFWRYKIIIQQHLVYINTVSFLTLKRDPVFAGTKWRLQIETSL